MRTSEFLLLLSFIVLVSPILSRGQNLSLPATIHCLHDPSPIINPCSSRPSPAGHITHLSLSPIVDLYHQSPGTRCVRISGSSLSTMMIYRRSTSMNSRFVIDDFKLMGSEGHDTLFKYLQKHHGVGLNLHNGQN